MMMSRLVFAMAGILAVVCALGERAHARAADALERGGEMKAEVDGKAVTLPVLRSDISVDISGDLAQVTVKQVFANPLERPVNASYLFPLNKDAAVHAMTMRVGDELIRAKIEEKQKAQQTFQAAKTAGKTAALLTQHRPNMFTQQVANLMPFQPVSVEIRYVQSVPLVDGAYELVVPLVVGPRYVRPPAATLVSDDAQAPAAPGVWSFSEAPRYPDVYGLTTPESVDADRIGLSVRLRSGTPIREVRSATHAIDVTGDGNTRTVGLSRGRTIGNRDFVLRYVLAGARTSAGLMAHRDARGGFFSLMIEPPMVVPDSEATPREMVFVLDTSGSMAGKPLAASKAFMRETVKHLRSNDYFRVISFSNDPVEFTRRPVPANPESKRQALAHIASLKASGGTEITKAVRQAFGVPKQRGTLRIVVFLTDGYIGYEAEVLRTIKNERGDARVYSFGVGTAVNRFLLDRMAKVGRGYARYIDPSERGSQAALAFAARLKTPALTDISIDWNGLDVTDVTPAAVPDLFEGGSIRVQGRFSSGGSKRIVVRGKVNGKDARLPVDIVLPTAPTSGTEAIAMVWARAAISDLMEQLMVRPNGTSFQQAITDLGLSFSLVTQFTSFVAVSEQVANPTPAETGSLDIAQPQVDSVDAAAYGLPPQKAAPSRFLPNGQQRAVLPGGSGMKIANNFAGGSTPEPHEWLALLLLVVLLWFGFLRGRLLQSSAGFVTQK